MTNAEARFNISLRPRKPEGSFGRTAQDGHLDSHTAPELCDTKDYKYIHVLIIFGDTALGCFYSHISTRTFRRALTASVDSCAEIKSAPSVA